MNRLSSKYNEFYLLKLRTVNHDILVNELSSYENEHDKEIFIKGFICSEIHNKSPKLVDSEGCYKTIKGSIVEPYMLPDYDYGLRYKSSKRDVLESEDKSSE